MRLWTPPPTIPGGAQLLSAVDPSRLHYWISAILAVLLLPLAWRAQLVLEPPVSLMALFIRTCGTGIIVAGALHLLDTPLTTTLREFSEQRVRLLLLAVMAAVLIASLGWSIGVFLAAVSAVIVEFRHRTRESGLRIVASLVAPGLYLLGVIMLMFFYNDIVVSWRFPGAYDPAFMQLDAWLGVDVPAISRATAARAPDVLVWAEHAYFGMFDVLGGTLVLIVLRRGPAAGMKFVGALAFAYYLTLGIFAAFPSQGPYFLCPDHSVSFPSTLRSYPLHTSLLVKANELWEHTTPLTTSGGYYISFPSMHVVKPAVAMWFLRASRPIVVLLGGYLLLLPFAIVVLEMHYFVDIPVGLIIAGVVIFMSDRTSRASKGVDELRVAA